MRLRVRVNYSELLGWHVDLPTYQMVAGSFKPVVFRKVHADGVLPGVDPRDPDLASLTCLVEVRDSYLDPDTGKLSEPAVRRIHKGHPVWDQEGCVKDVQR